MINAPKAEPSSQPHASMLLDSLDKMHAEILDYLDELERLAACVSPTRSAVAEVRWKLSKASRRRWVLINETIHPLLLELGARGWTDKLRHIKQDGLERQAGSGEHVRRWPIDAALADWAGYGQHSAELRESMRARIAAEKRVYATALAEIAGAAR
jgi:hypothetical protein